MLPRHLRNAFFYARSIGITYNIPSKHYNFINKSTFHIYSFKCSRKQLCKNVFSVQWKFLYTQWEKNTFYIFKASV